VTWVSWRAFLQRPCGPFGIRVADALLTVVVAGAVELNVYVGGGPGTAPLSAFTFVFGAVLALPILARRRWPLAVLLACTALMLLYYTFDRRDISPAPLLSLPIYDAALAGYLVWALAIPAGFMVTGLFVVGASTKESLASLFADFLPSIILLGLAVLLGEVIRGRRVLAAETAQRLRVAQEEREAEAARRVAEERLRIARDLHDTVAHSMATITVQAGSALHLLGSREPSVRTALAAIRETSKDALREMRATLGQLRQGEPADGAVGTRGGLDRLPALRDAVTAAGAPVTVAIEGEARPLPGVVDEVAYRILQESLTNVLRHAGPAARATVKLRYEPTALAIEVTDDGQAVPAPGAAGHGLTGMAERAAAVGGRVTAGPGPGGGFEVRATLPVAPAVGTAG
jgi:signal transduction histidine kinase